MWSTEDRYQFFNYILDKDEEAVQPSLYMIHSKTPWYPKDSELGATHSWAGTFKERKFFCEYSELNHNSCHTAHRLVTIPSSISLLKAIIFHSNQASKYGASNIFVVKPYTRYHNKAFLNVVL